MARILVIDDHPLVRRGIVQVLSNEYPEAVIGEASNDTEALAAVWSQPWNLVLLDLSLPGRGGLEVLKEIKNARPKLPVLVVSSHPESQFATRVLRAGAAGYVSKESPPEILVGATHQVLAGEIYVSPALAQKMAAELGSDASKPRHEELSDREYDVMLRLAAGQSVGSVADSLHLSVKTISTYRTRVLEKMGMQSNAELTQYALRNHLIE